MKKIILIIVAVLIVLGIGCAIYLYANKPNITKVSLSSSEISQSTNSTTEFFSALKNNDFADYKNLCSTQMATESVFNTVKDTVNNKFGTYESSSFVEAFTEKGDTILLYKGNFTKNKGTSFTIAFTKDNKIDGIRFA